MLEFTKHMLLREKNGNLVNQCFECCPSQTMNESYFNFHEMSHELQLQKKIFAKQAPFLEEKKITN